MSSLFFFFHYYHYNVIYLYYCYNIIVIILGKYLCKYMKQRTCASSWTTLVRSYMSYVVSPRICRSC